MSASVCLSGAGEVALAAPLRVRAQPQFQGIQVTRHQESLRVTGSLRDEATQPLATQAVLLHTTPASEIVSCDGTPSPLQTDSAGAFCFEIRGRAPERGALTSPATPYLEVATRDFPIQERPKLELEVSTPRATWPLTTSAETVRIELRGGVDDADQYGLRLELQRDGKPALPVAEPRVLSSQKALEFTVSPAALGAPGPVNLLAILGDDPAQPLASKSLPLLLVAPVSLTAIEPPTNVRPELGFEINVQVSAPGGGVEAGMVEALTGEKRVGSATVEAGVARVACRFIAGSGSEFPLRLRYVPQQTWWQPGQELELTLSIARAPSWIYLPWILVGALAAVWIFRAWWRPAPVATKTHPPKVPAPASPGLTAHEPTPQIPGWRGFVRDLHTRETIPGARLRVVLPSVGVEVVATTVQASAAGSFELPPLPGIVEGARIEIEAPNHSRLRLPMPPQGTLEVSLVSRRRKLLQQLSDWVTQRRWQGTRPLTPGDVASAARRHDELETERWALDVEAAAFGSIPVDEHQERSLSSRAPALPNAPFKR